MALLPVYIMPIKAKDTGNPKIDQRILSNHLYRPTLFGLVGIEVAKLYKT